MAPGDADSIAAAIKAPAAVLFNNLPSLSPTCPLTTGWADICSMLAANAILIVLSMLSSPVVRAAAPFAYSITSTDAVE